MERIGIWIDKEKAYIIHSGDVTEQVTKIESGIENYKVRGGSTSKTSWGPQDVVQDSKYLEREKHQFKSYFKEVTKQIEGAQEIAIFGPAEAYLKFEKELKTHYKSIGAKIVAVRKTDSMTENQMKALVRDYFDEN